jgi:hypothetical protein
MSKHFHRFIFLCILYLSTLFILISCQRSRYRDERRFDDDRNGLQTPGNIQNPPVVEGSYFDSSANSQQRVTNEPPKFDWTSRRRANSDRDSQQRQQQPTYRRTVYRRQNTTRAPGSTSRRRYESLYNTTNDSQNPSRPSISSSIDALLGNQSSPDYRGGSYTYQTRRNTSIGTSRSGTINGQSFQTPILWQNRTWHWSTNRTREYDPDLDGTTLPPPYERERHGEEEEEISVEQKLRKLTDDISHDTENRQSFLSLTDLIKTLRPEETHKPVQTDSSYSRSQALGELTMPDIVFHPRQTSKN